MDLTDSRSGARDDATTTIDRERAMLTCRSVLTNLDLFTEQGLKPGQREVITRHAVAISTSGAELSDHDAATRAGELREALADVPGPTAAVLVTWLDDAIGRTP